MTARGTLWALGTPLLALMVWLLWPAPAVPYTADRLTLQPVDAGSSSLVSGTCQDPDCSSYYNSNLIQNVLVSTDRRVVLSLWDPKSIVVESSSSARTIQLDCHPYRLAQLPSGLLVVTCPRLPAVLPINIDSKDHEVKHVPTKNSYWAVAARPLDNTLVVSTVMEAEEQSSIDVISLQGEVIRTLVDPSSGVSLKRVLSLTVADDDLLVSDVRGSRVYTVPLTSHNPAPLLVWILPRKLKEPSDAVVDKAGNVFLVCGSGYVMMKTPEGHFRSLLKESIICEEYVCRLAHPPQ